MTDIKEDILRYVAYRFTYDQESFEDSIRKHRRFVDSIPNILRAQKQAKKWRKLKKNEYRPNK